MPDAEDAAGAAPPAAREPIPRLVRTQRTHPCLRLRARAAACIQRGHPSTTPDVPDAHGGSLAGREESMRDGRGSDGMKAMSARKLTGDFQGCKVHPMSAPTKYLAYFFDRHSVLTLIKEF